MVDPKQPLIPKRVRGAINDRMQDAVSDAEGRFALPPLSPGRYNLVADVDKRRPGTLLDVTLGRDGRDDLRIALTPTARIEGRAVGPQGGALREGVTVVAVFESGAYQGTNTDAAGAFTMEGVPTGNAIVLWQFEMKRSDINRLDDPDKAPQVFEALRSNYEVYTLRAEDTLQATVTVPRRTSVEGAVLEGGRPAEKVRGVYFLQQPSGEHAIWTPCDAKGTFTKALRPGTYDAYLPMKSGRWMPRRVEIPDQPTFVLELERPTSQDEAGR